jgi:hypothetical protein
MYIWNSLKTMLKSKIKILVYFEKCSYLFGDTYMVPSCILYSQLPLNSYVKMKISLACGSQNQGGWWKM